MPYKKVPCPECGQPKSRRSKVCIQCRKPYDRTPEMRQIMSENAKGKQSRGTGWHHTKATRKKMAGHWTPERRAAKRLEQQLLYEDYNFRLQIAKALTGEKNPNYQGKGKETAYSPGYGAKYAKKLREQRGHCEMCGKESTLQMHHKDFDTTNHLPENLSCLCCSCHRKAHVKHKKLLQQSNPVEVP